MGVLQRGFPTVIDALSSPQVSPDWLEALGEQNRILPFCELGNAGLILTALCQEALLLLLWLCPKQNRLPFVSSRLHHWLRLPHRCPSLRNRVLSLYYVSKFSASIVTKRSRKYKALYNRIDKAHSAVFSRLQT